MPDLNSILDILRQGVGEPVRSPKKKDPNAERAAKLDALKKRMEAQSSAPQPKEQAAPPPNTATSSLGAKIESIGQQFEKEFPGEQSLEVRLRYMKSKLTPMEFNAAASGLRQVQQQLPPEYQDQELMKMIDTLLNERDM